MDMWPIIYRALQAIWKKSQHNVCKRSSASEGGGIPKWSLQVCVQGKFLI